MTAPQKCESPVGAGLIAEQSSQDTAIVGGAAVDHKRLANVCAKLALKGFQVHPCRIEGWLVCKWDLSRYCRRLEDLERFLTVVGGTV